MFSQKGEEETEQEGFVGKEYEQRAMTENCTGSSGVDLPLSAFGSLAAHLICSS
jgi:hypothetical protein